MKIRIITISTFFIIYFGATAQNAKTYYKEARTYINQNKTQEAIDALSKAINIDPKFFKAYQERAPLYEKLGKLKEAGDDYIFLSENLISNDEIFYNAGRIQYLLKNYEKAVELLNKATYVNKRHEEAYLYKIKALIELNKFEDAIIQSEQLLGINANNAVNHYYHGLISDSLGKHDRAEYDYAQALVLNKSYEEAYIALAKVKVKLNKKREAVQVCDHVIKLNDRSINGYLTRAEIHHELLEYPSAINDLSKIILLQPSNVEIYIKRGIYYLEFNQPQNAINDFSKALTFEQENINAYYYRGRAYEEAINNEMAVKDYKQVISIAQNKSISGNIITLAQQKLFELKKESNKPVIEIIKPKTVNSLIVRIPGEEPQATIKGIVKDESEIEMLKVNDIPVEFIKVAGGYEFTSLLDIAGKDKFTVMAADIYNNVQTSIFVIERNEADPPGIALIAPYASDHGEIYLDSDNPSLYIEGKINDESLIKSILIEGTLASFKIDEYNPTFSANISIINKNKFTIKAMDEYGNENVREFFFNREGAVISQDNPMGKTWVVFIENSNYESFASLEGPTKDVRMMKSALASYEIHNTIHKKDMTKAEMEKFFSIELRDLVRSNRVNSLLVWYAGHGKFINETGYWIPVDATRDDEFSYFNINTLKASLQAYSTYVTHTLVITDACESGPTFYQAMRSTIDEDRNCNDWNATRFKSSQVFSSAGYELAVDNSQFTRTFAGALENNPNACIPIEKIVTQVKNAVRNNNQQEPKFGKIAGLVDENGTFFFVAK
ncbi:MAG: caspase family protein [Bacteroidales bacterium]|nr:caspase family protein [Bacteroidales bacterium]